MIDYGIAFLVLWTSFSFAAVWLLDRFLHGGRS